MVRTLDFNMLKLVLYIFKKEKKVMTELVNFLFCS